MNIYCSGIGGIGLSAYAALQNALGHTVFGSDKNAPTALTEDLERQGITVFSEQDGSHVSEDIDLFVYSEAIPESASERVRAAELDIPQQSYFKALGELSRDYAVIGVCGTHGKSTTTAMAAQVLIAAGLDPTVVVGTKVPQLDGRNWRKGESNLFLLEACEYRGSFLNLHPNIILMSNVDGDHFDAYASVKEYQDAYKQFVGLLPENGVLITHMDDPECADVAASINIQPIDADTYPLLDLSVPGKHMQENAQLVLALADHLGCPAENALKEFQGTWRRFELKGTYEIPKSKVQIPVIDDYAHHPKEIEATIASAKQRYNDKRIVCLYQPHMHDRTLRFFDEFSSAFTGADTVIATDVYDARPDAETGMVDIDALVSGIAQHSSVQCIHGGPASEVEPTVTSLLQDGDVLVVMGAGNVTSVAEQLVAK